MLGFEFICGITGRAPDHTASKTNETIIHVYPVLFEGKQTRKTQIYGTDIKFWFQFIQFDVF